MKKSNVIIYALLVLASVFLLWLWYFLGFNRIDEPLDLVLTIIWWAMIAAAIFAITRVEKARKERVRTVYVSDRDIFNSETGKVTIEEPSQLIETVSTMISDLKYGFTKEELPEKAEFDPRFLIHTSKKNDDEWEGEVVDVWTKITTPFKDRDELAHIVATRG